ncbi:D123-domain-containing protein [Scheffersomyces amazonensis]|uniref:D123-domain-containing protein n=1 Tax=Scheffersomyces amazonensis TaxID=1078765 RepID=UPI00315D21FE
MTKEEYVTFETIETSKHEILSCSYSQWYELLKSHTVESKIIKPLPQSFIEYLNSDSIKLPPAHNYDPELVINSDNEYSDWEEDEQEQEDEEAGDADVDADADGNKDGDGHEHQITVSDFQDLHDQIISNIHELGGVVTPKLNWSAPKDAKWMMPDNTIRCDHVNDIYLLLNTSDHIVDDLDYPFASVDLEQDGLNSNDVNVDVEYELVLRKWMDINPALEFRTFIKDNKIIGISQRDLNHYMYLESLKETIHDKIHNFIYDTVIPVLSEKLNLSKYIVDVYIPRPFNKVYIVDINPFTRKSSPLLFTWNELLLIDTLGHDEDNYEFKLVNETNLGRFAKKEYSESQVPYDVVDASMNSEAMIELAREWDKLQVQTE